MTEGLTKRQREILTFIQGELSRRGMPPTVREIAARFGISSPNGVQGHLRALRQKGFLRHEPGVSRGIVPVGTGEDAGRSPRFPLVGEVAAGGPKLAVTTEGETVTMEEASGARPGDFMLTVKGDSMTGAGINPGDMAVVRPGLEPKNGDVLVVMVGDEDATLKRFYREKGGNIRLVPENPEYDPIVIDPAARKLVVAGKVVGVIRRY